ncbi:MAG TPA: amidase [Novosphingobium sp.]|nr:amidase [Novosphingobium sp.]HZV09165.1 amidase [Novosphingobium sp.]
MSTPATAALDAALRRIAATDREIRAWTHLAPAAARAAAAAQDRGEGPTGPLAGIPIGIKDVIDVAAMPTSHNSPLGLAAPAIADAPCVATLRAAGALILGKTDTTEFAAAGRNAATANPHDGARTPGGSSSGSAAAVAAGHVPLALATQTGGSTIRPASFCGIHALKPTWGQISREGAKLYAASLDTIGLYASSLAGLDLLAETYDFAPPPPPRASLRIGLCRTPYWPRAEAETQAAMADAAARLAAAGAVVEEVALPAACDGLEEAFMAILFREGAAAFLNLARAEPALLHADFHQRVAARARYPDEALRAAYDLTVTARIAVEAAMAGFDAFLAPSAPGVAPLGRGPGNPIFNQMWTQLHLPVVHLPLYRAQGGLPLGLSLVAPRFADRALLAAAARVEALLGRDRPL